MKRLVAALMLASVGAAQAATLLSEGFDDVTTLPASGWDQLNNSVPTGGTPWQQGNEGIFPSAEGASSSFISASFLAANSGGLSGTISSWLILPTLSLSNGDTFSFRVRAAGGGYLDTVEFRLSTAGAASTAGTTTSSVGDYTTLLGTYSTAVDDGWVAESFTMSGLAAGTSARLAFRYVVADVAVNGNYIGVDSVLVSSVPEPATTALWALGVAGLALARRRG